MATTAEIEAETWMATTAEIEDGTWMATTIGSPYIGEIVSATNTSSERHDQELTNITSGEATVIALVVVCTIFLLLLNLCWQQCRRNEKTIGDMEASRVHPEDSDRSLVMAREIRPGLVLVQGSPNNEEVQRIVNEYDLMKSSGKSEGSMFSYPYRDQPPEYVQVYGGGTSATDGATAAAETPRPGVVALVPGHNSGVSHMSATPGESRPPAYAPGHSSYGALYPRLH